jgi:hypothetical protein
MAGRMLVDLIESSSKKVAESISKGRSRNARRNTEIAALEQVRHEATGLQKALLTVRSCFLYLICVLSVCFCLHDLTGRFTFFMNAIYHSCVGLYGGTIAPNHGLGIE